MLPAGTRPETGTGLEHRDALALYSLDGRRERARSPARLRSSCARRTTRAPQRPAGGCNKRASSGVQEAVEEMSMGALARRSARILAVAAFATGAGPASHAAIPIGGAIGAVPAGLLGSKLDGPAEKLGAVPDAEVQRKDGALVVDFSGDVLFTIGSVSITSRGQKRLRAVAVALRDQEEAEVIVRSYTDSRGSESLNQRLSEERAEAVRRFLTDQGVSARRVTAVGLGERFPVTTNETEAGRKRNRRIEIEVRPPAGLRE